MPSKGLGVLLDNASHHLMNPVIDSFMIKEPNSLFTLYSCIMSYRQTDKNNPIHIFVNINNP